MDDGRGWVAQIRRLYLHAKSGGTVTAEDIGRILVNAEMIDADLSGLKNKLNNKGEENAGL